ncbi:hypothetical protein PTSG_07343 [Salpingoeca rosetta]|uniref:Tectonic-1-3 domain-containing protein n=1 Tax=Salpingoeca rosetta (strain ATCC 50818 / BSB-021) TaxID=946362 RepID=F2UJ53_SALR5|nr:uncharacterized protein PTSG_07343 [Salpingoeca rosetta]EGD77001.1 hypothetical protein PTSG_07343 [Salpingoeca rosetta]|eukprot:XP_004990841.1 hypothetical protein PTSG_07343 [Salpingoeca rosetta]
MGKGQFDGEADLASACSGLLSIDAFVTSLSSIIANPATLQLVSVVLPPSGLPDTTFINGTCAHAAASIAVTFIWGEDGVSAAHVDVTAANVTQSQPFVQTFAVTFARSTDAKVRSGRPGYLDGRPLLMQDFEYSLIGVDARSTRCSEVGRRPLAFNENSLSMCQLEFSVDDFSDCNALRANFRQHLGLPSSSSVPGRVGIYGDSDTSAAGEWIDVIHTTTREYADQELFLNYTQRPLCNDVPRRAEIQVLVTSQGHPQNPQMIVFGAQVTTYTRHLYITATTPAPPVSNVTLTTAPPTNTTAAPTNATAAPSNATAEPVRQVELVSVGVSFVYVDPGAAGLKRRRNHRPHSCFRGTCWHVPFRTAQRRWTTDPQVQAHYAAVLARFIAVMICIACLGVLSLVIHMQGPRR